MYTPPDPCIIKQLVGSVVELISFGRYVMHFSLENGDKLSVSCPFRFESENAIADSPICEFPLLTTIVMRTLGSEIVAAECESDGTLRLRFSNGDILIAYANDPGFEAYTLSIDAKEYVV